MDHRYDILLMGTGCKLRNHTPEQGMDILAGRDVRQDHVISNHGRGSVVAGRFNTKDV